jgi:hypothetical protein
MRRPTAIVFRLRISAISYKKFYDLVTRDVCRTVNGVLTGSVDGMNIRPNF